MGSRLGVIGALLLMLALFLWLGPQQSLLNLPTGSTAPSASASGTHSSVAMASPTTSTKRTPPGQAKKTTPTPTPSYPILPSLPPGYSPTPTPVAMPTPTPTPTTGP